jgi:hypothetical protein
MRKFIPLFFAVLALAVIFGTNSDARSVIPPVKSIAELAGCWLGETDSTEYVRIELNNSGVGRLAIQWLPSAKGKLYEIQETHLKEYKITFVLRPLSDSEPIQLVGSAVASGMNLTLSGDRGWKRTLNMRREEYVLGRIKSVTDAFAESNDEKR